MNDRFQTAYDELFSWCREHDFAGHDPFDALNSRLFQSTPLAQSRNARFIWTQLVKRSPSDFRAIGARSRRTQREGDCVVCARANRELPPRQDGRIREAGA